MDELIAAALEVRTMQPGRFVLASLTSAGAEQQQAARLLGVSEVRFCGFGERSLLDDRRELHENLVRVTRQVRPQRVVTWSLEWNWTVRLLSPCHLATGAAALTAIYPDTGNPFVLTYLREEPWTVQQVWLISSPGGEVNHHVDIIGTSGRKVAAVTRALGARGYTSRPENTPQGRFATPEQRVRRQLRPGRGQAPSPLRWRRPSPM